VQAGHVTIKNRAAAKVESSEPGASSSGTADRASFDGETQRLTLSGNAHLEDNDASLVAPVVVIDQATEDAEAQGGVQATMESAPRDGSSAKASPVTHVLAASARFAHAAKTAEFRGTDAQPAKMWQDASQVQAATLLFDGVRRTFSARPEAAGAMIHSVFAGAQAGSKAGVAAKPARTVRVASPKMDYNDALREAIFSGGVTMEGGMGVVRGERAVVFLTPVAKQVGQPAAAVRPNPFGGSGGSIDRVVVSGAVQMEQPGRKGTGEQLVYVAATGQYVLTGTSAAPPRIVDAQQGNVTGTTLVFSDAGSTIVVAGEAGAAEAQGGRVRSEMSVKPKTEERQ
jgi:lipopolysaccharide export system protein LptA